MKTMSLSSYYHNGFLATNTIGCMKYGFAGTNEPNMSTLYIYKLCFIVSGLLVSRRC